MRFAIRRSDLPHEPQKANLAEPLALNSWSRCTDKNFTDFAKNGVFQQYRLISLKNSLFLTLRVELLR